MLGLVASFTGGKTDLYSSIATAFAQACNFKPYVSSTCPPKTPAPSTPYGTKCPA
ncbi:hypothetical protein HaLaN_00501 [Haematococcus lacustris]|uniref:Uncharacterized protein n=1 Tax=Haematococcus lacustris TaxID=44745 RepID=A0A699Y6V1_HAELA|nr:hypothetical protein HaLaN_00501 [Haematococcus lacustris]